MEAPVYLFTGPEFGKRNEEISSIKSALTKKLGTIDEHLFYLLETPFSQVMTIVQSGTLFSNGVCVVCKNAELLKKKEELEMLEQWIGDAQSSSVLILVSDEISVDAKLEKLIPPANKKKFWEMFESEKLPWVMNFFGKNGYKIEEDAANLILDMVQNNTQELKNECSRFFLCFPKDHEITSDDVESVLAHTREENAFTLFNTISDTRDNDTKRFENGVSILQEIRLSKDNSSVMIIAGLASCFRKLVLWHEICRGGYEPDENTLKSNGFGAKMMRKQYKNASKIWTIGQATAILAVLASIDMEIRSGGSLMEDVLLQKMLYEIIIKKGASSARVSTQEW